MLVEGGQLGYDLGVVTPEIDRQIEMKSSPAKGDILELLARLTTVAGDGRYSVQLVHGKANKWTEALDLLLRNAGEAANDGELRALVTASADAEKRTLFDAIPAHPEIGPKDLLAGMAPPEFIPPTILARSVQAHDQLLAGERADDVLRRLTTTLTDAFRTRTTLSVGDLHAELVSAGLIYPVTVVTPPSDPMLTRAVGVLDVCRAPLPEPVLAQALEFRAGEARGLLADLIVARVVLDDSRGLWRPRTAHPVPRSAAGSVVRRVLALLVESPPPTHLERVAQVPNILALAAASLPDDPYLAARAFKPYDKASKATGDLSSVYLLARTALEGAAASPTGAPERDRELLWLRAHARICGTSWTLQRVGQEAEASAEMDAAREESLPFNDTDNLAFVDKCQGRLSRLRAERLTAVGDHDGATLRYDESRGQLDRAYQQFVALLDDPHYAGRYQEEPGSASRCAHARSCRRDALIRQSGTPSPRTPS